MEKRGSLRLDSDSACPLHGECIESGGRRPERETTSELKETVSKRALSMVNVCDDAKVANSRGGNLSHTWRGFHSLKILSK
jgi:hypothetical protein